MFDLTGRWDLVDETGEVAISATIPGDTHSALLEAGLIPDPFSGRNETQIQWVGRRGWTVRRRVDIDAATLAAAPRWLLEFEVVDTVAEVFVNGTLVGRSSSMFVPLRLDVADALRPGTNEIEVRFDSPERAAAERAGRLPYPVPHQIYPQQSMHRNLLRKVQCHGSWDWGIAMMVSGLYGAVTLRPAGADALRAVWVLPRHTSDGEWTVPVHVEWDRRDLQPGDCDYPGELPDISVSILDPSGVECAATTLADAQAAGVASLPTSGRAVIDLSVSRPELWWPAGYGAQPLYTVRVTLGGVSAGGEMTTGGDMAAVGASGDGATPAVQTGTTDTRTVTTAFRTVEVVNRPDEVGASMFFRVNGRDIWAKGANWIPIDAFPSRQTDQRFQALLTAARDANMNMIRVWGGGQYEPEVFYRTCDELGLLVWQDFMFSCSLYPSESWFLDEVREEVRAQVRRLASHPSIAIWCGNNENVGALGWFEESIANPGRYLIDFDRLNTGVIASEVRAVDDTRVFWPSSPAAGEGDFSDNWHDDSSGDMHYWSVWHEGKPFTAYYEVTPRFCSEFGFQSFPGLPTLRSFAAPDQLNPTAPDLEHHQRHERGNTVVLETMSRYFRFPFTFGDFVYLSQVQQAMAIGMAVTYWRSRRPVSMGALYWQLNDLWPVVSWSSIEYSGAWKLLHYEARRFFAPLRLAVFPRDGEVEAHLLNDTAEAVSGSVVVRACDWSGIELWRETVSATVAADAATEVWRRRIDQLPFSATSAFLIATMEDHNGVVPVERDFALLAEYKDVPLRRPTVSTRLIDGYADIDVADAPAFWLTLEVEHGGGEDVHAAADRPAPADNGFLMLPGERRRVWVGESATIAAIRTIADTY